MPSSTLTADEYDIIDHGETALNSEDVSKIVEWLEPTDYLAEWGEFRRHLASQAPGTGLWICETEEYRKWHGSQDHGSLWIKGVPGAGKSVMAASIIQHLQTTEDHPVLFFFFRNIVSANFSPRALMQDWLAQLVPYSPKLQFALQARLETKLAETPDAELIQLFMDGVAGISKVYCVGDALDEMSTDQRPFLDRLNALANHNPRSLKLLITSRPKQYLQTALRDSSIVHVSLQQRLVDADINAYLHHRFDSASKSDVNEQAVKKRDVVDMVAKRAGGLFLYAKLTMDQVEASLLSSEEPIDIAALEAALPVGLEQIYNRVLLKQRQENEIDEDVQVLVLEAVTHASRPLRLNELASLVQCLRPKLCSSIVAFKALIATCCGPLVEILEDETLQVIHHSFTEFLRGDTRTVADSSFDFPIINSDEAHKRMAINCLRYLQSGSLLLEEEPDIDPSITYQTPKHRVDLDEVRMRSRKGLKEEVDPFDYREARLYHPFLGYAVENWWYHASRHDARSEDLFTILHEFVQPGNIAWRRWLVLQWGSTSTARGSDEGIPTVLHVAAFAGLSQLAEQVLHQGSAASPLDAQERTPLHWAIANGHAHVASLLIKSGADPNAADGCGVKPIHLAARKNDVSVVKLLLQAGVEPNTTKTKENHPGRLRGERTTIGQCAILYATESGYTEMVLATVPYCKPAALEQLLCESCRLGRTEAVLGILKQSDVSAEATYLGATALYFACSAASLPCVEALINRGADVNKTSQYMLLAMRRGGRRDETEHLMAPIHCLVQAWKPANDSTCRRILRLLLEANVDIDQLNGNGDTALLMAAGCQDRYRLRQYPANQDAIRALVNAGASVKHETSEGDTVIHLSLGIDCNLETTRLLIEHGADINKRDDRRANTPLMYALGRHGGMSGPAMKKEIAATVDYLLSQGADPDIRCTGGKSAAVMQAMHHGPEVFHMVLSRSKNESVKQKCWFSLATIRDREDFISYVRLFQQHGINVDVRNPSGRTLYLECLEDDDFKIEILRDYGAKFDIADKWGDNALHLGCRRMFPRRRLEKFISEGLDPLSTNKDGDTLLHHAASTYHGGKHEVDHIHWLIGLGVPVNAVNKDGQTPLHVLQVKRCFEEGPTSQLSDYLPFLFAINLNNDVNFSIRDRDGLGPIHRAAKHSFNAVAFLTGAGADLGFLTANSENMLHISVQARNPDIVRQILEQQQGLIDVNHKDPSGKTPLHYACILSHSECVRLLLNSGTDVHATYSDGLTVLHACSESRRENEMRYPAQEGPDDAQDSLETQSHPRYYPEVGIIVEMLLDAGVDVSGVGKSKLTALEVALDRGCMPFVEVFMDDEQLFSKATKNLGDEKIAKLSQQMQELLRPKITLMAPTSCVDSPEKDKSVLQEATENPLEYLDILSSECVAKIINDGFESNQSNSSYYTLVAKIVGGRYLAVARRIPRLLSHYNSYESLVPHIETLKNNNELWGRSMFNTLQLACSSMPMLRHLVEEVGVKLDEPQATFELGENEPKLHVAPGGTALHKLAYLNSSWELEALRYLLSKGASVNVVDEKGQTPLHAAACLLYYHNEEVEGAWKAAAVRELLDSGADPNLLDNEGFSPVHRAASSGATQALRELLSRGADVTIGVRSPLFEAIREQRLEALEVLLDHGVSADSLDVSQHSPRILHPLTDSCRSYALLCTAYVKVMERHISNSTPLLRALVQRGADLNLPLNDDETMIHHLVEFTEPEVLDTLFQEPCMSRIDFNRRDQHMRTVLMAACRWTQALPVERWKARERRPSLLVLDSGRADATLVDNDGKTALHHLLENPTLPDDVLIQFINREEVAPTLNTKDKSGFTPFHYALRTLRPRVCRLLLSKGADLQEIDPQGLTALHHVVSQCFVTHRSPRRRGNLVILPEDTLDQYLTLWREFLAGGCRINDSDNAGNTPLLAYLLSADRGTPRGASKGTCHVDHYNDFFPAESGVDVFAANHDGETALHVIARRVKANFTQPGHDKALFQMMMGKGLDPLKEDARGRSALDVASACEKDDIVALLRRK